MKILQVCSAESLGGGERHVIDLTRAMIERGHQLHLAVRHDSPLIDALAGYPIHWYELGLRNALDVISAQGIAQVIRKNRIDVMHAHLARDYTYCGIAARIAARLGNPVGFFITRHHFNPIKSNPIYAWTIGEARALIAVSDSVRENLVESFPDFTDRIVTIPNWIDASGCGSLSREEARARLGVTKRLVVGVDRTDHAAQTPGPLHQSRRAPDQGSLLERRRISDRGRSEARTMNPYLGQLQQMAE